MQHTLTRSYTTEQSASGVQEQVGNYLLLRALGRGGYAHVYLAEHLYLKHQVALKLLNLSLAHHEDLVRFQFEARLLAQLRHRHIVRALDFGWERGTAFLAMDYAPGGTIQQVFPQGIPQPISRILPIVLQIADGLQYVHNQHVIHCDIKPENILIGPRSQLWIGDFGIATTTAHASGRHCDTHEVRGTGNYMAPEQIYGKPLPASDQYALAVMVYEWLCGQPLFDGSTLEVCARHVSTLPPHLRDHVPSISRPVERVVLKALEKVPQQRFAHVLEFAAELKRASVLEERACSLSSPLQIRN